jgi:hypothetical protein
MAHLRIIQIVKEKGKGETLKLLPGEFASDRECWDTIKEPGNYLFLEVHTKSEPKPKGDGTED